MPSRQTKRRIRVSIVGKYLGWVAIRAGALIAVFALLVGAYNFGVFEIFGNAQIQIEIYYFLLCIILSFGVWFFLAFAKKIIIPATVITVSPTLGKIVRDPTSAKKTNKSLARYLTYLVYAITIGLLVLIWAYELVGTWFADLLGSGLVIMLTFILGLFSSSVLGNVLGYAILGGTHEFKVGDRVQIGDIHGDIIDIGFFFIHIRTIRDEIISIPNLTVMNKEIHNYSAMEDVALNVQVTLGYDVDKDHAQETLIEAAKKTSGILSSPDKAPFVLLKELGSYAVTYDLNAYTDEPNRLVQIKSELISNMLIDLKKAGIVIATPTLVSIKGEEKALPPAITQYLDNNKTN
jgi:small-conductance mechanosensitive channel